MNDLKKKRSRLACRIVRAWAAIREDDAGAEVTSFDAGLPAAARRHAAGCPECRLFFIESRGLEQMLKREAAFGLPAIPEGLESRVAAAVAQSQPPEVRAFPGRAVAACGVAAIALAVFIFERQFRSAEPGSGGGIEAADVTRLAAEVTRLPGAIWETAGAPAAAVWTEEPLRREADAVYSDARSAVGFLRANFIPDSGVQAGPAPSS
jgi:hypothetical protein